MASLDEEFAVGLVKAVGKPAVNGELLSSTGMVSNRQTVKVEVLEGRLKGQTFDIANEITDLSLIHI